MKNLSRNCFFMEMVDATAKQRKVKYSFYIPLHYIFGIYFVSYIKKKLNKGYLH